MSIFLTPRVVDMNRASRAIILYDGWRNVLETGTIQYALSSRDGSLTALPQLLAEGNAKRFAVVPAPDDSSPWGASVDWDALNDLEAWTARAQSFVDGVSKNLQPPAFNQDAWNNYLPQVPKTPEQEARQLSAAQVVSETIRPYIEAAAQVDIPMTFPPSMVAQPQESTPTAQPLNPVSLDAGAPDPLFQDSQPSNLVPVSLTGGGTGTALNKSGLSLMPILLVGGAAVVGYLVLRK